MDLAILFTLLYFIAPLLALLAALACWMDRKPPMAVRRPRWRIRLVQRWRGRVAL